MTERTKIKNSILKSLLSLKEQDRKKILEEINLLVLQEKQTNKAKTLMDISGLGKEIWSLIDVEKYITNERNNWD